VFGYRLAISGESLRQLVRSDPHVPSTHIPVFTHCASSLAQDVLTSTLPQDVAFLVEVPLSASPKPRASSLNLSSFLNYKPYGSKKDNKKDQYFY
jgi:hypothetical protein